MCKFFRDKHSTQIIYGISKSEERMANRESLQNAKSSTRVGSGKSRQTLNLRVCSVLWRERRGLHREVFLTSALGLGKLVFTLTSASFALTSCSQSCPCGQWGFLTGLGEWWGGGTMVGKSELSRHWKRRSFMLSQSIAIHWHSDVHISLLWVCEPRSTWDCQLRTPKVQLLVQQSF